MSERDEEWISRVEWRNLLRASEHIGALIANRERQGMSADDLWERARPIRQRIRSDNLKVCGIDDRFRP